MTTDAGASDFVSDAEDTSEANDLTEGSKVSSSEPETATENSDQDESLEVATGAITASSAVSYTHLTLPTILRV